jgi:hypothetical protein
MNQLIKKLPLDIVLRIIPYTYNVQNNNLLNDIYNYTETKITLLALYHQCWIIERQMSDPEEDKNWLINDIFAYANNYNASMYGYIDKFYNIFKRNIFLRTKEQIDKYVDKLEQKEVMTQINIFLGLLTPLDRVEIITYFPIANDIE